jgi:CRP-like cAMP-binding protein
MIYASPFIRRLANFLPSPSLINPSLQNLVSKSAAVEKGGEIFAAGMTGRQVVCMGQGIAMRYRILPDGSRQVIMFLMPGDMCSPHIYPTVIDHHVAAVTPVRVDKFDCESLIELSMTMIGLNQALCTLAEEQNAIMRNHITSLGRGDTRLKVAMLLTELAQRILPKGTAGPVLVPITQSLLADAIGVTHIHFNRVVSEFARRGAVDTCRGGIQVKDLAWLSSIADEMIEAA